MRVAFDSLGQRLGNFLPEKDVHSQHVVDINSDPDALMSVSYARILKGTTRDMCYPYDEVLVIVDGAWEMTREDGTVVTASDGDVVYMPANSRNRYIAREDTTLVCVIAPPDVCAAHWAAPGIPT
jgi:ethanolamine utilization protein EutQ (cupin superfamily)